MDNIIKDAALIIGLEDILKEMLDIIHSRNEEEDTPFNQEKAIKFVNKNVDSVELLLNQESFFMKIFKAVSKQEKVGDFIERLYEINNDVFYNPLVLRLAFACEDIDFVTLILKRTEDKDLNQRIKIENKVYSPFRYIISYNYHIRPLKESLVKSHVENLERLGFSLRIKKKKDLLHIIRSRHFSLLKDFIKKDEKLLISEISDGNTLFHLAALNKDVKLAKLCLSFNPKNIKLYNNRDQTPLELAQSVSAKEVLRLYQEYNFLLNC